MMNGDERRQAIIRELQGASCPISGSALARAADEHQSQRQRDHRPGGHHVVATSRGYVLREGEGRPCVPTRLVKVHHGVDDVGDELNTIVDLGGAVLNVMVNHRVYGKITADLDVRNRRDAERYLEGIRTGKSYPLMTVTSGYHFHRIAAETEEQLDEIEAALRAKGYLAEILPYEDGLE